MLLKILMIFLNIIHQLQLFALTELGAINEPEDD
jgi:hypothetical protein